MKALIINKSSHHDSTLKIAKCMSEVLNAKLIEPKEIDSVKIQEYDVIGFGSGIYSDDFHKSILDIVDNLSGLSGKRVFVFSTAGVIYEKSHRTIKAKLKEKSAVLIGDFYCKGFNTNSFLKIWGGMNKGRPNDDDMKNASEFAEKLFFADE